MADASTTLGQRIRTARIAAGMSLRELAEAFGVRVCVVQAWERDHNRPSAENMAVLTARFGVQADAKPQTKTPRRCLGCGDTFASEGIHNRICDGCKGTVAYRECVPEYAVVR